MFYTFTALAIYFITKIILRDSRTINVKVVRSLNAQVFSNPPRPRNNSLENVGIDLYVDRVEDCGSYFRVYTGVCVQPPKGYYFDAVPRSSIYKKGLILYNSCGIIDQSYTGEIQAMFFKTPNCEAPVVGERLIQLIPRENLLVEFEEVSELEVSERGNKGFGENSGR
jgi:dUTP pyrophosphatase